MSKISIRFYKDHKVRAVWDEEKSQWWFSILDIVGAINEQDDHEKNRNYWKYIKAKLRKEQSEVVRHHRGTVPVSVRDHSLLWRRISWSAICLNVQPSTPSASFTSCVSSCNSSFGAVSSIASTRSAISA